MLAVDDGGERTSEGRRTDTRRGVTRGEQEQKKKISEHEPATGTEILDSDLYRTYMFRERYREVLDGPTARIPRFHRGGPGSTPGRGMASDCPLKFILFCLLCTMYIASPI